MKLLFVTRQFYPARGGIETVVLNLGIELLARGHQVSVVTLNRIWGEQRQLPSSEIIKGIQVYRIPFWGPKRYALSPMVLNFLPDYDLVAIHSSDFFLDFLSSTNWIYKKPLVLHTHGMYFHTPYAQWLKKIYFKTVTRFVLNRLSLILCVSQQDFRLLNRIVDPSKLHHVPNGIDCALFNSSMARREPGFLVSVGRLAENKRYDRLLEVFSLVVQQKPDSRLIIIGRDEGEAESLSKQIGSLGLTDKAMMVGEVDQNTLSDYLSRAALWLSSSQYESFGVGLLEGMAAGCIPVVSDIPAFRELVVNGENGFLVDFTSAVDAANTIIHVIELSPETNSTIVKEAGTMAKSYSWNEIANKVEALYQSVLER